MKISKYSTARQLPLKVAVHSNFCYELDKDIITSLVTIRPKEVKCENAM